MLLSNRRALGHSGLLVSPLTLGTMTYAVERWGSPDDVSEAIFNAYIDAGGNSIDTADVYSGGKSEELTGQFIKARSLRDKVVLATKCGFNGGNSRKNIYRALEASLRRLDTDYIDLYWMHVWDGITPVEEVVQTLCDLTREGKIRYYGFSDNPAWYAAKAATIADLRGMPKPIATQLAYSLVERSIEQEHIPAAAECGLGIVPWAPLAAGFLAGKYTRDGASTASGEGRLTGSSPYGNQFFTDRNWEILDVLRKVSEEAGKPMAQIALAWVMAQPGVTSPIVGASKLAQLEDNIAALALVLTQEQLQTLNVCSALTPTFPYAIFTAAIRKGIFGTDVIIS